jgi:hypothetical protein
MKDEIRRNFLGFVLLAVGLCVVHMGHHTHIDKEEDAGFGFIGMAALALQVRRAEAPKE